MALRIITADERQAEERGVSVIFDFGVGAIDWRGAWFNPGT